MSKTALSASDEWATEQKLFDELCNQYGLNPTIDLAANHDNTKCFHFFDEEDDALSREWDRCICNVSEQDEEINNDRWCNPPHSQTKAFMLKAHEQWKLHNINIMMLVPAGVLCRKYFQEIFEKFILTNHGVEWHPVRPRPRFVNPLQKKQEGARQDYIVIIWRTRG